MSVHLFVFGSYIESWRGDSFSGATFDDGSEPSLQYAGCAAAGRMRDVNHTRPSRSIIGLWMLVWPSHGGSLPQYADTPFGSEVEDGISGSRYGCRICVAMWFTGSSTGTMSVLSSVAPSILPLALIVELSLSLAIES